MIPDLIDPREFDAHERYDPPNPVDNAFDEKPPRRDPDYYCLAIGKHKQDSPLGGKWKYCYARAGAGTNHVGYGRCKFHGGSTSAVENRYAAMVNDSISAKIAKFLADPNPLDLRAELAAARAIFENAIERHEEYTAALLAWHASFDKKRRGLHDAPLYNFEAIKRAYRDLKRDRLHEASDEELHAALEAAVEDARASWAARMAADGRDYSVDLKVEKPMRMLDISHAASILKTISTMVSAIIKHEQEAYLSAFAYEALQEYQFEAAKKIFVRHLRRLGVSDGEAIETLFRELARAWDQAPVLEHSVPRLAAERRRQDQYLGS